jgi:hypothetical protein
MDFDHYKPDEEGSTGGAQAAEPHHRVGLEAVPAHERGWEVPVSEIGEHNLPGDAVEAVVLMGRSWLW